MEPGCPHPSVSGQLPRLHQGNRHSWLCLSFHPRPPLSFSGVPSLTNPPDPQSRTRRHTMRDCTLDCKVALKRDHTDGRHQLLSAAVRFLWVPWVPRGVASGNFGLALRGTSCDSPSTVSNLSPQSVNQRGYCLTVTRGGGSAALLQPPLEWAPAAKHRAKPWVEVRKLSPETRRGGLWGRSDSSALNVHTHGLVVLWTSVAAGCHPPQPPLTSARCRRCSPHNSGAASSHRGQGALAKRAPVQKSKIFGN